MASKTRQVEIVEEWGQNFADYKHKYFSRCEGVSKAPLVDDKISYQKQFWREILKQCKSSYQPGWILTFEYG